MEKLAGDLLLGSKANFSFQIIASNVWYSMEKLAGDLNSQYLSYNLFRAGGENLGSEV